MTQMIHCTANAGTVGGPRVLRNFVLPKRDLAPVAQLDRALDSGSKGWGFEPLRAHNSGERNGKAD